MKTRPAVACLVIASGPTTTRRGYNLFGVCKSALLGGKLRMSRRRNKIPIITAATPATIETAASGDLLG